VLNLGKASAACAEGCSEEVARVDGAPVAEENQAILDRLAR
jgi:hypothetical protein